MATTVKSAGVEQRKSVEDNLTTLAFRESLKEIQR